MTDGGRSISFTGNVFHWRWRWVSAGQAAGTHCALSESCSGTTNQHRSCDSGLLAQVNTPSRIWSRFGYPGPRGFELGKDVSGSDEVIVACDTENYWLADERYNFDVAVS